MNDPRESDKKRKFTRISDVDMPQLDSDDLQYSSLSSELPPESFSVQPNHIHQTSSSYLYPQTIQQQPIYSQSSFPSTSLISSTTTTPPTSTSTTPASYSNTFSHSSSSSSFLNLPSPSNHSYTINTVPSITTSSSHHSQQFQPPLSPHSSHSQISQSSSRMKKRFVWSESLHYDFIRAIFAVGLIHCNSNNIKASLQNQYPDHAIDSIIHRLRLFNAQHLSTIEKKNQKKRTIIAPIDELTQMNKLINTQVELLEKFRQSVMKQISIRDKLSNMITKNREQTQVNYIEGVDLGSTTGTGLVENRDDNSNDGSSTRSIMAPIVSRPRESPTPTNTTGISSVAGATRHIVMPPPTTYAGYQFQSGYESGTYTTPSQQRASSVHSSDAGDFFDSTPIDVTTQSRDENIPQVPTCDPNTVNRHRSELYMLSAMRSHMNMHRELLQFNSQYTSPVILSDAPSQSTIQTPIDPERYSSSDATHTFDLTSDSPLIANDANSYSHTHDMGSEQSNFINSSTGDDDLDTSLFDFLF